MKRFDYASSNAELNFDSRSRRSVVYGTHGLVASSQPLACQAGLEILRQGGNAADAAVATAAALNITEPCSCGIGGDCFVLFYEAKTKQVRALNGSGRSPKSLTLEHIRRLGITDRNIPLTNLNAVTVPGAAAGFVDTLELFGSGKVTLHDVLAPAIRLAEEGYPVSEVVAHSWSVYESLIRDASDNAHEMLKDGRAPRTGEIMKMPTLAKTLREIADKGRDGFYKGYVAEAIVQLVQSKGGRMTLEDLAEHSSTPVEPIRISYQVGNVEPITIWECPPNGQGLVALMAIGILEQMQKQNKIPPLAELEHNSVEYLHALIEALRFAFADGSYFIADPHVAKVPVEELLSGDYLSKRAAMFDAQHANEHIEHGHPVNSSDTVYFCVTDEEGNACSFICSNYAGFGTGAVPKGCGFTLQNRGSNFILEENHLNGLRGGKRPYHTIIPSMITHDDGDLLAAYGVMGGFMQPQGHVQVLMNLLHHRMSVQTVLDAPRFCIGPNVPNGTDESCPSEVFLEEGIAPNVVEKLRSMGHRVTLLTGPARSIFGRGQMILKVPNAENRLVWAGGSDLRADGHATGW